MKAIFAAPLTTPRTPNPRYPPQVPRTLRPKLLAAIHGELDLHALPPPERARLVEASVREGVTGLLAGRHPDFRDALAPLRYGALLVSQLTAKVVRRPQGCGHRGVRAQGGRRGRGGVG